MVRGKVGIAVELGSKISISYIHGYIFLDEIGQENFNESTYLQKQVEKYYEYITDYTESIHLEKIYPRKGKRKYSQQEGIRMIATEEKKQARINEIIRNIVEGKLGEGKKKI